MTDTASALRDLGAGSELDVSVIIVSYNVREYLAACLQSLPIACEELSIEVFVVDNASHDESEELVRRGFPGVNLIVNDRNLGFARAVNQALPAVRGRYVLLLNPDTVAPPRALTRLVEIADGCAEAALVGPALRDPATGALQASFRQFPSWKSVFRHYTALKPLLRLVPSAPWRPLAGRPTTMGWLSGACLLIRRRVVEEIGKLDDSYFMWFEDIEYCRRAIIAGHQVLYTLETSVFHHEGQSTDQEPPATMLMVQLKSLFRYLETGNSSGLAFLKPLFKVALLGHLLGSLPLGVVKVGVYIALAHRARAEKHRRRLGRRFQFLRRFAIDVVRL